MEKKINQRLTAFLDAGLTCYHVVENLRRELAEQGYALLAENENWQLTAGGKYMVIRGGSALIAFRVPQGTPAGFLMAAAHCDTPTFKVREVPEVDTAGGAVLSVEPYGGAVFRSWVDRPLSVAGRLMAEENGALRMRLVNVDRDLFVIPGVAPHLDRTLNEGSALKAGVDMRPLLGASAEKGALRRLAAEAAGVEPDKVVSTELFLYPRAKAAMVGMAEEYVSSPRLDDLQCVFACKEGFLAAEESASIPVLCVLNNEEVGSGSPQGADSDFLQDTLSRISAALGRAPAEHSRALAESFMVSADNAHAVHPNHPEYSDTNEKVRMNEGVVIKYSARLRYCTDAESAAVFRQVCRKADVPVQTYSNRADLIGGSTLGRISTAHVSVPTVDVGLAQLSMHSACELAGAADTEYLARAMAVYYGCALRRTDGGITL